MVQGHNNNLSYTIIDRKSIIRSARSLAAYALCLQCNLFCAKAK